MATYTTLKTATKEYCSITSSNTTYDTAINRWLNDAQQDFATETNWKYLESRASMASSTFKFKYTLAGDYDIIKSVIWEHEHYLTPVNHDTWVRLNLSDSTGLPRYYIVLGGSLHLYPKPDHSAYEGVLKEGMSSGSTDSMVMTGVANLEEKGRVEIDTEIIEYSHIDSIRLRPLLRGLESTGQIAHLAGATVTQRNIEYDYYKVLTDLSASTDVSGIPTQYHRALPLFAAAKFFYKTEDKVQGDSFMSDYLRVRSQAKRDLSQRQSQSFSSTLDDTPAGSSREFDNTIPDRGSLEYL